MTLTFSKIFGNNFESIFVSTLLLTLLTYFTNPVNVSS